MKVKLLQRLYELCYDASSVVCYGAGDYGGHVYAFLKRNHIKVSAMVISNRKEIGKYQDKFDIPVYAFDDVKVEFDSALWLVCISSQYRREVVNKLLKARISSYYVITKTVRDNMEYEKYSSFLMANKQIKKIERKNRCFILCNGPSVKKQDLSLLCNEDVFSCSLAYLMPQYDVIRPRYYVIPNVYDSGLNDITPYMEMIDQNISSSLIFLDVHNLETAEKYSWKNKKNIYYIYQSGTWNTERTGIFDLTKRTPDIQTSPIMMLKIAMYMGYKEIYLLGTEHDTFCTNKEYRHAYDANSSDTIEKICKQDENNSLKTPMRKILDDNLKVFNQYHCLHNIATANGIKIYNATAGGKLDEFDRREYDKIF